MADCGYDSDPLVAAPALAPAFLRRGPLRPAPFSGLKQFRRGATRNDKLGAHVVALIQLAATVLGLHGCYTS